MANDLEIRTCDVGELRVETRGTARVIRGYAIVFNRLSEILGDLLRGTFREIITPQAIDRTLREGRDLMALIGHDSEKPIGRLSKRTLRVDKDAHGLRVEIDLPPVSYAKDIEVLIERGDVAGMSFAFQTMPGGERFDFEAEPPVRHVTDMLVREVSVVTFPAYPDTTVAMRALAAARQAAPSRLAVLAERLAQQRAAWGKSA